MGGGVVGRVGEEGELGTVDGEADARLLLRAVVEDGAEDLGGTRGLQCHFNF